MSKEYRRGQTHTLEVWGELACFTRPEAKVERYSYPVITPSAARGIFDAIYFKRSYAFFWQIEAVELLALPRYIGLRRNEVKNKAPYDSDALIPEAEVPDYFQPIEADDMQGDNKGRTQRQTMALKNVRYRLHAHMCLRQGATGELAKMEACFVRRAASGKCFYQPYFGCREFPAWFSTELSGAKPESIDLPLGWMVYDTFDLAEQHDRTASASISLFHATLQNGVMKVPTFDSPDVKKVEMARA